MTTLDKVALKKELDELYDIYLDVLVARTSAQDQAVRSGEAIEKAEVAHSQALSKAKAAYDKAVAAADSKLDSARSAESKATGEASQAVSDAELKYREKQDGIKERHGIQPPEFDTTATRGVVNL